MRSIFEYVIDAIKKEKPEHISKIQKKLQEYDASFFHDVNSFWSRYEKWLGKQNQSIDFAIDSYLKMLADIEKEQLYFYRTGNYSNTSFADVEKSVYLNPEVMTYHMHGLVLAQFLWYEQYQRFVFFKQNLKVLHNGIKTYLEVAGGHGLYIWEATKQLQNIKFDFIDISESSIKLAKGIVDSSRVNFILGNIFQYHNLNEYHFINAGEILEHLENPLELLVKIRNLLKKDGVAYITVPINAPMIDHIFLFESTEDVRSMILKSEMDIVLDKISVAYNKSEKFAKKHKLPVMYAAFIKKMS